LNDRLPNDLAEIGRSGITDPWGNEYEYVNFEYVTGSTRQSTWARVARKDRFLVPLNTYYDLFSTGFDGETRAPLQAPVSQDDVVRASDGGYVGKGSLF
ncbi:MAG: prepilin-type cleavage/methylation domain-containing protein, partial [Gemmatimonadota bacterium]|nr:prepilin-type cleavage/methylation domain-containing protein [Gemmatimonadota bacterium]